MKQENGFENKRLLEFTVKKNRSKQTDSFFIFYFQKVETKDMRIRLRLINIHEL
ncbi:hypothetical protein GLV94_06105 [Virgibacillus halodenitrificans]|uniref:hypothetical protein n=1 Tax=Virgibacillus halodenitrificans TaxID=1482 RepID=UPI001368CC64|nr:hypothetical protein [Virgibacillus halodenitrificans]MYL45210.1 hypothetical protein [Virgibacillus halodenitrificans]